MARKCSVCAHEKRAIIDNHLVSGAALRAIAGQHNVSRSALDRHKKRCLSVAVAIATESRLTSELRSAHGLRDHSMELRGVAIELFNAAVRRGDEVAAAAWFDRTIKASKFQLDVETVRQALQERNGFQDRLEKYARYAKLAEQFLEHWNLAKAEN